MPFSSSHNGNVSQGSSRVAWIDVAKALSILTVVLYHTDIQPDIKELSYKVCLPAFFFLSGMFAKTDLTPLAFFKRRTLRLLVPYLVYGIVSWVAWLLIGRHYGSDAGDSLSLWEPLAGIAWGTSERLIQNAPLWFLACLMVTEWLWYGICRISENRRLRAAGAVIVGLIGVALAHAGITLPWSATAAMLMLPLYAAASLIGNGESETESRPKIWPMVASLVASATTVIIVHRHLGHISISHGIIGNPVLFYAEEVVVVAMWCSMAQLICRATDRLRLVTFLGQNTLTVLSTHMLTFGAIKAAWMIAGGSLSFFSTNAGSLCLWGMTIVLSLPIAWVVRRYLPALAGKIHN